MSQAQPVEAGLRKDLRRLGAEIRERGAAGALLLAFRSLRWRLLVRREDRRFDTGKSPPTAVADAARRRACAHGEPYVPTPSALFRLALREIREPLGEFVFVDLGSGKGRVLLLAAEKPFKAVIGVEYAEDLHAAAEANIRLAGLERRASSVLGDAADFPIPGEPCVFYLYNPFGREILRQVIGAMEASYAKAPRPLYVIYFNPKHRELFDRSPVFTPLPRGPIMRMRYKLLGMQPVQLYRSR